MTTGSGISIEHGIQFCRVELCGTLGGYQDEILTENLSDREKKTYKCSRCNGIMKDASFNETGEQFCACCKQKGEQPIPHANVRKTILSLKCICPLSRRGCEWLGSLESVENHLVTCGRVYELCRLFCGLVSTRENLVKHVREECNQRKENCSHCSGVHKVCEMERHVQACGKVKIMCELGCGASLFRENVPSHIEQECLEETVQCPYRKYSCEVEFLKRRYFKQHLEENRLLHTELKLNALEQLTELKLNAVEKQTEMSLNRLQENMLLENALLKKRVSKLENNVNLLLSQIDLKDRTIEALTKEEVEILQYPSLQKVYRMKLVIDNFLKKFKPHLQAFVPPPSRHEVSGYNFVLWYTSNPQKFIVYYNSRKGPIDDSLEWPFKAIFITRIVSQSEAKDSLIIKSLLVVRQKVPITHGTIIVSIPYSADMKDFVKSNNLELDITIRILKNV